MTMETRVITIDPIYPEGASLDEASRLLQQGGLVSFPTDTFYALGADPFNPLSIERVFLVKERARSKPLLLAADLEMVAKAVEEIPPLARKLIHSFWPGPLTLVMKASSRLPPLVTAGTFKVGLRVPRSRIALALLNKVGFPLTGTSANLTGGKDPTNAEGVLLALKDRIDMILDGGSSPGLVPSTILDITTDPPIILREGSIPLKEIAYYLPAIPRRLET